MAKFMGPRVHCGLFSPVEGDGALFNSSEERNPSSSSLLCGTVLSFLSRERTVLQTRKSPFDILIRKKINKNFLSI